MSNEIKRNKLWLSIVKGLYDTVEDGQGKFFRWNHRKIVEISENFRIQFISVHESCLEMRMK